MAYHRLSYLERIKIEFYHSEGYSLCTIAFKLNRSKSTISRELARFKGRKRYKSEVAHDFAKCHEQSKIPKRKLTNPKLFAEVYEGLKKRWSPEQISMTLRQKYPDDESMQVSHESIYTYIYVLPRGELRSELMTYLRQKKTLRTKRSMTSHKRRGRIIDMISIEERPKEVANRSLAGDWEGDLVMGKDHKTAIGTLVERKTRLVLIVPLKEKKATDVRKAFEKALKKLPQNVLTSLTYDQGMEMAEHKLFEANTKMKVYFCHPSSPWERGTCENTNGLIRDYFPKKTDFSAVTRRELKRVQDELNERPRKALEFRTPKEVFNKEILKIVPLEH